MAQLLKGKDVASVLMEKTGKEAKALIENGIKPTLAILRVGNNQDDVAYERSILRNCEKVNIEGRVVEVPIDVDINDFIDTLQSLNTDPTVHGILIFRPLPKHLDENRIKHIIDPSKDVDCMNPLNLSKIFEGEYTGFPPCTPAAVMEIIKHFGIELEGKNAVVIGRSVVVGKPLSMMLLKENATVTICHSRTEQLESVARGADILVAAIGRGKFVTEEFVKDGAIVLDVGINIDGDGKLCGDVDYDKVKEKASFITPVPGGVGSVTTAILLSHVVQGAKN